MSKIEFNPIGKIYTPFQLQEGMPIQPTGAKAIKGVIEINKEYQEGLKDLEGFSHVLLIYHFHKIKNYKLSVIPFMDDIERGIFATRAPSRPNPIGISVVRLVKIEDNKIYIENMDVLDETPLLDIKPIIPDVDFCNVTKLGWLEGKSREISKKKSDKRFNK